MSTRPPVTVAGLQHLIARVQQATTARDQALAATAAAREETADVAGPRRLMATLRRRTLERQLARAERDLRVAKRDAQERVLTLARVQLTETRRACDHAAIVLQEAHRLDAAQRALFRAVWDGEPSCPIDHITPPTWPAAEGNR